LRPTRALQRLIVAAACAAALGSLSSAAASGHGNKAVPQWAYFDPVHGTTCLNMDLSRIESLARAWRRQGGELLWFQSGGRDYFVRDPGILERARAILKAQRDLDPEEAAIEKRSKSVEAREARFDREQDGLDEDLERIESERDAIHDRRSRTDGPRDRERLSQLNRAADAIRERKAALSARRKAIYDEMAEVSRQERALDRRQSVLEARSDAAMSRLCLEVLAAGRAQRFTR